MSKVDQFIPYKTYKKNISQISDFEELTDISYNLSQQLLFKYDKKDLPKMEYGDIETLKKGSFCRADVKTQQVTKSCYWLSIEDFAEQSKNSIQEINKLLSLNKLGTTTIDPKTNEILIIWPQTQKNKTRKDLPEPGKSKYKLVIKVSAAVDNSQNLKDLHNFENIQKRFLTLAHSIGKPNDVNKNSINILYRSCFLLQWNCFEVYLRSLLDEIIRQNPIILFGDKQSEKLTITYKDLFHYSNKFESLEVLQSKIIENEIAKQEGDGKSIHGIINFIKSKLSFEEDPYKCWYQLKGKTMYTSYQSLIELKDVRNSLMHDAGFPNKDFFTTYSKVSKKRNGEIVINQDYYLKAVLSMKSIAYNLAESVAHNKYKISNENLK